MRSFRLGCRFWNSWPDTFVKKEKPTSSDHLVLSSLAMICRYQPNFSILDPRYRRPRHLEPTTKAHLSVPDDVRTLPHIAPPSGTPAAHSAWRQKATEVCGATLSRMHATAISKMEGGGRTFEARLHFPMVCLESTQHANHAGPRPLINGPRVDSACLLDPGPRPILKGGPQVNSAWRLQGTDHSAMLPQLSMPTRTIRAQTNSAGHAPVKENTQHTTRSIPFFF